MPCRGQDGMGFYRSSEQAFRLQFSLQLLKRQVERTCTVRNDLGDVKLHRACARERADARPHNDLHAVLQTELEPRRVERNSTALMDAPSSLSVR